MPVECVLTQWLQSSLSLCLFLGNLIICLNKPSLETWPELAKILKGQQANMIIPEGPIDNKSALV